MRFYDINNTCALHGMSLVLYAYLVHDIVYTFDMLNDYTPHFIRLIFTSAVKLCIQNFDNMIELAIVSKH